MKIKLKNVRLSFSSLWVAREFEKGDGRFSYKASFLMLANNVEKKATDAALLAVANEKWPKKGAAAIESFKGNSNKICFVDGNLKEYEGYEGMWALSASRGVDKGMPTILDHDKTPLGQGAGRPYDGCYVDALVDIWAQENKWGKGLRATLLGVQYRGEGPAFTAGASATDDDFDNIEAPAGDDDIAF